MQPLVEEYRRFDLVKTTLLPWIICFAASLFLFYEFIQGNMFASIADNIMRDFHIQADKMTYLSSIYYLANVIFLFIAGILLDRFSTKKTIVIAMLLCILSTFLLAYAHSFYLALFCRFVTGIGSAFCFLGPIRIASRWFPPNRMALVTGVVVTIAMTGGMLAQYPLTKLVLELGWRDSLIRVGWLGVALLLFMMYWIKDKPQEEALATAKKLDVLTTAKMAYLNLQTFRAALYTSLMNMPIAVLGAMIGSLYLMQRLGVSKEDAALVNSMLFLGAIVGGPAIGWFSDKLGLRVLPMKLGVLASLLTLLGIMYLPVSLTMMGFLFFLLGFFTAAQVISYALVAESSPAAMTAMAVSMISLLTQGGYILYQNLFSAVLLWHGDMHMVAGTPVYSFTAYQTAALIMPLGLGIALFALFKLKETYCRHIQG
ncbi:MULTISPECIES: MFS transporter [Legionella]|uniref:MFS transporter n=1 Tax=Legionella TaxID=445 RepID=UPI000F8D6B6A|nr:MULTISPECIES: MFS transporter [Legionella]MCP0913722.1 MFS transporter [Legionella sp. 27cVA30]RUQ99328.1 MFS transporter [Legionella septentrionalis]RUR09619.1 MFS transporter [Legionella septentrionalis]RUR14805.1 MFS transporter [Legionella septentrionalis]